MQGTQITQGTLPGLFRVFKPTILFQAPALPPVIQQRLHPSDLVNGNSAAFWNQSLGHYNYPSLGPPPPVHVSPLSFCDVPSMVRHSALQPSSAASVQNILSQYSDKAQGHTTTLKKTSANTVLSVAAKSRKKKFPCPLCDIRCSNNGQLQGHLRIHTGERPFKCLFEGCERSFARNEELTRHKRIHTGIRPHKCDVCTKAFGRKDHLSKHQKTHLQAAEKKVFTCSVLGCGQKYSRSDALTRHQWSAHSLIKAGSRSTTRRIQENTMIPNCF